MFLRNQPCPAAGYRERMTHEHPEHPSGGLDEPVGEDLPPELRYADSGEPGRPAPGLPVWVRLTALVLVVAVLAFYALSYFM